MLKKTLLLILSGTLFLTGCSYADPAGIDKVEKSSSSVQKLQDPGVLSHQGSIDDSPDQYAEDIRKRISLTITGKYHINDCIPGLLNPVRHEVAIGLVEQSFEGFRNKGPAYKFLKEVLSDKKSRPIYGEFSYGGGKFARVLFLPTRGLSAEAPESKAMLSSSNGLFAIDLESIRLDDSDDCETCRDCLGARSPCSCTCIILHCVCDEPWSCDYECNRKNQEREDCDFGPYPDYLPHY